MKGLSITPIAPFIAPFCTNYRGLVPWLLCLESNGWEFVGVFFPLSLSVKYDFSGLPIKSLKKKHLRFDSCDMFFICLKSSVMLVFIEFWAMSNLSWHPNLIIPRLFPSKQTNRKGHLSHPTCWERKSMPSWSIRQGSVNSGSQPNNSWLVFRMIQHKGFPMLTRLKV